MGQASPPPGWRPSRPANEAAAAGTKRICVSWRHFQEERWRIDEAGIKSVLEPAGYTYVSADAQADPQKQLTDVENLIAGGCDAAIILAQDSKAVLPAIDRAKAEKIPVIAYDAPIDSADVTFVSFDNVAVGRLQAEGMVKALDHGNWVAIEGDPSHPIVGRVPARPDGGAAAPHRQGRRSRSSPSRTSRTGSPTAPRRRWSRS